MTANGTNIQVYLPQAYSNSNWCGSVAGTKQPSSETFYQGNATVGLKTPTTFNHRFSGGSSNGTHQFITIGY